MNNEERKANRLLCFILKLNERVETIEILVYTACAMYFMRVIHTAWLRLIYMNRCLQSMQVELSVCLKIKHKVDVLCQLDVSYLYVSLFGLLSFPRKRESII